MSRPPLLVRMAGAPLPAIVLFLVCGVIVVGWSQGEVPWWLALGAVGGAFRTLSAVRHVRRYKAWRAEWEAMGATDQPRPKDKRVGRRRRVFVTCAALLLLAIPACVRHLQGNEEWLTALTLLCVVTCIYLVGLLLRRMTKRRKAQPEAATTPVEWMLGRASSSPSRSEATRKLPEYCTRLLGS
jgi:hypothetical protein